MNSSPEFLAELESALLSKIEELDRTLCPQLKENCSLFHSHFFAIYDLMLSKGVLKQDPYKNDRHLSDLKAPHDEPLMDAEIDDQLPIRLSEYDNILDFLVNYGQFSVSGLSLKNLKLILAIIKFINWATLTPSAASPTTKAMAVVLDKIRLGSDSVATSVTNSNHSMLEKLSRQIQKDLKDLADFKRDEYKIAIRARVLVHSTHPNNGKDDFVRHVKALFPKHMPGESFFPELVGELYEDLVHESSESFRQSLLDKLKVTQTKKKTEAPKVNLHAILLEGLRMVGTTSRHLDESLAKLEENNEILKNRPRSFMEKFKEWIVSLTGPKQKETMCSVEIIDIVSTMKRTEVIPFESFCIAVGKKSRSLSALSAKGSSLYQRYESGKEEESYEFLNKCYKELRDYHEKLEALDLYFKTETPQSERTRIKGIKVELTALKNGLSTINQKLHEYIARKEEQEQLRKLGIGTSTPPSA